MNETDDGGATIDVENEPLGREFFVAVPPDGHRRYFSANSDTVHLAGAVVSDSGLESLCNWVAGLTDEIAKRGLKLPT